MPNAILNAAAHHISAAAPAEAVGVVMPVAEHSMNATASFRDRGIPIGLTAVLLS